MSEAHPQFLVLYYSVRYNNVSWDQELHPTYGAAEDAARNLLADSIDRGECVLVLPAWWRIGAPASTPASPRLTIIPGRDP